MKKFLVIYFGGATASEKLIMPDEKAQHEFMMAWANWAEKHKDAVIDFGCPLSKSKSIHPTGVWGSMTLLITANKNPKLPEKLVNSMSRLNRNFKYFWTEKIGRNLTIQNSLS